MYIWNYLKKNFNDCIFDLFNLDNQDLDESDIYLEDIIEIINDV